MGCEMYRLRPRGKHYEQVDWLISERVRVLVAAFADYAEREPYDVVDEFLSANLPDLEFLAWLGKQRNSKRRLEKICPEGLAEARKQIELRDQQEDKQRATREPDAAPAEGQEPKAGPQETSH